MKGYVDLFVLPIPKKKLSAYIRIARQFGKIMETHGALEYREFKGEDLKSPVASFISLVKPKPGEIVISSVVEFKSRKHRDKVNQLAMKDPRMLRLMKNKPLFDAKRMIYGGFETFVKM